VFIYDQVKEADRKAKGQDHCGSSGRTYDLASLLRDGVIHDPADSAKPLDLSAGDRVLICAVNEGFEIRVGFDSKRGTSNAVKHETLFHNADVRAAGEMEIKNGVITAVNDASGTYGTVGMIRTDPLFVTAVLSALDRIEAPISAEERERLVKESRPR
jgi:hypothetical protein